MSKVKQLKEYNGCLSCLFEHEVSSTKAKFDWTGPCISPEVWNKVLAFFRWTYKEHTSESQVRLFVNPQQGRWEAWAFPQQGKTGMTSKELDTPEAKEQRQLFPDSDGWLYFGTVHHHCSASAFQSGTDRDNEENQDGLHITIGNMNSQNNYDMHVRLYLSGFNLDPDMSWFWDVTPVISAIPKEMIPFISENALHKIAVAKMTTPPPDDQTFPDQWRQNYIEVRTAPTIVGRGGYSGGLGYGNWDQGRTSYGSWADEDWPSTFKSGKKAPNHKRDKKLAYKEWVDYLSDILTMTGQNFTILELLQELETDWCYELFENLYRNDVDLETFIKYCSERRDSDLAEAVKKNEEKKILANEEAKIPKNKKNGKKQKEEDTLEGGHQPALSDFGNGA